MTQIIMVRHSRTRPAVILGCFSYLSVHCKAKPFSACLQALADLGYTKIVLQIGRGKFEPSENTDSVELSYYRYKNSLEPDIVSADLIISHAGSGTCLEVLAKRKPLIVVVNQTLQVKFFNFHAQRNGTKLLFLLQDNHQIELAERLAKDDHLRYCTPETLIPTVSDFDASTLVPFEEGNPKLFADWLNNYFCV